MHGIPCRGDRKISGPLNRGDHKISRVNSAQFFSPSPPVVNVTSLIQYIVLTGLTGHHGWERRTNSQWLCTIVVTWALASGSYKQEILLTVLYRVFPWPGSEVPEPWQVSWNRLFDQSLSSSSYRSQDWSWIYRKRREQQKLQVDLISCLSLKVRM